MKRQRPSSTLPAAAAAALILLCSHHFLHNCQVLARVVGPTTQSRDRTLGGDNGNYLYGSTYSPLSLQSTNLQAENESIQQAQRHVSRRLQSVYEVVEEKQAVHAAAKQRDSDVKTPEEPPVQKDVTSPPSLAPSPALSLEFPLSFDVNLNIEDNVDIARLKQVAEIKFEEYIQAGLQIFESEDIRLSKVDLTATLVDDKRRKSRRQLLRYRDLRDVKAVQLNLEGVAKFELDPQSGIEISRFRQAIIDEIELLLQDERLKQFAKDANLSIDVGADTEAELDRASDNNAIPANSQELETEDDGPRRPGTLSIIFGFLLTAIGTAGLCVYGYIFYKKFKKRQRRKQQMRESVVYKPKPALTSSQWTTHDEKMQKKGSRDKSQEEFAKLQEQVLRPALSSSRRNNFSRENSDSSGNSSYGGIGSESSSDATDDFAKELERAASLDKRAWERTEMAATNRNGQGFAPQYMSESTPTARAFPYGDEDGAEAEAEAETNQPLDDETNQPLDGDDEGLATMAEDSSSVQMDRGWEPYLSRLPYAIDEEENGIEVSSTNSSPSSDDQTSRSRQSSARASQVSASTIEALERQLTQPESVLDPQEEPLYMLEEGEEGEELGVSISSDIVREIDRLAKFVHRYEKKKERQLKRANGRLNRSTDSELSQPSSSKNLDSTRDELQSVPHLRQDLSAQQNASDDIPHIDPMHSGYSHELLSISEAGSADSLSLRMDSSEISRRLGITPYRPQPSLKTSSYDDSINPKLTPETQDETLDGAVSMLQNEASDPKTAGGKQLHKDATRKTNLVSLRQNGAVVDSLSHTKPRQRDSSTEVNAMLMLQETSSSGSIDAEVTEITTPIKPKTPRAVPEITTPTKPKTPRTFQSPPNSGNSAKFNKIKMRFEGRQRQDAIFPPDSHWQYNY